MWSKRSPRRVPAEKAIIIWIHSSENMTFLSPPLFINLATKDKSKKTGMLGKESIRMPVIAFR